MKIVFGMLMGHILSDFWLQPICLSQMKCKSWWIKECEKNNVNFKKYQSDYIVALIMHSISWAIMILFPFVFFMDVDELLLLKLFLINTGVHAFVDDLKANRYKINLWTDQFIHLWQMLITFYIIVFNPTLI
jgi:hypothetical protein